MFRCVLLVPPCCRYSLHVIDVIVGMLQSFYESGSPSVSLLPASALDHCMRVVEFLPLPGGLAPADAGVQALRRALLDLHGSLVFLPAAARSKEAGADVSRPTGNSAHVNKRKWSAAGMLAV
jgi:hypothetical protein